MGILTRSAEIPKPTILHSYNTNNTDLDTKEKFIF